MTKRFKVAVIGLKGLPAFGGAAAVGENLIEQLKAEYDFTVLSISSHTTNESTKLKGYNQIVFKNFRAGGINTLVYYLRCLMHCLWNNYDLVHLHHAGSGFITPFLRLKYKVVVTFHGLHNRIDPKFSGIQNRFFRFSEKLNVYFANQVISVSIPDQEAIFKKYNKLVKYVPNGIDVNSYPNLMKVDTEKPGYLFFAAGRIYQIKGLHLLFKAASKLNLSNVIKIAGDLNQVPSYKTEVDALSENLNLEYLGLMKDKVKLMGLVSEATIFIFPSVTEAMSMMLLEVVSMNTPVIASNIPANTSIFNNSEMLFFETENFEDLAEKISYALSHPLEMKERAKRAYEKLVKNYNWQAIASEYKTIYSSFLN